MSKNSLISNKQKAKALRQTFNLVCLARDGGLCVICKNRVFTRESNVVHHITDRHEMPNDGYAPENGITLCHQHHWEAEFFHMSGNKQAYNLHRPMHPNDLYKLIDSSYEKALEASKKL